jgi:WD40 repeat protein
MWDAQTGAEVRRFSGHLAYVWALAFSPDGTSLLTASAGRTARLWNLATGKELRRFGGHTDQVNGAAYSPNGKMILTGSHDHTARLWEADYHDTIKYLCGKLVRDFTAAERAAYDIQDDMPTCPPR